MSKLNCNMKKSAAKVLEMLKNSETTIIRILRPLWFMSDNPEQQIRFDFQQKKVEIHQKLQRLEYFIWGHLEL